MDAASLRYGDISRLTMYLQEGQTQWHANDEQGRTISLPLAVKLHDFHIEEYEPTIAITDKKSLKIIGKPTFIGDSLQVKKQKIRILTYWPAAFFYGDEYRPNNQPGACHAAYVMFADSLQGWFASGSYMQQCRMLIVDNNTAIVMLKPTPKKYSSHITVYTREKDVVETTLEVNKPFGIRGWKLYQSGYDESKGVWSSLSIISIVNDPWLPVVYVDAFMLIAGAVCMFWTGKK